MNNLKVISREHIGKYEFTGIEGGFGKNKKAMLVKDIAKIHGRLVKEINKLIKQNSQRFKNGIDLIDLKQVISNNLFSQYGFTKAQWGNANNIYLLSERGYSKLLKILEDDKAWEIYDQLVDNYFNMRQSIKENQPSLVAGKRLEIMEKNAATRKANLLYKIAQATSSETSSQTLLAHAAKELTGEMTIPVMKHKEYTATEVGEQVGKTANKVGRICNQLGLKAEQPGQNKYGRWANGKSKYSPHETPQWLYFDEGVKAIKDYVAKQPA
ncbi:ORF6N domain-containing protein [Lactiplantibacillus plantarum]|uniref:ORF6N domain-containing protein n=1 Tax=Lactiplantibacillus plantarum TaxID=1590 RepID=UPI001BA58D0F|nr:ORF6N domain-containing protein [Lactiplantibacillus plantarum]MBS0937650.1 ORF6N domain-containing protein [Lactiplantibacillus plantarum]MBS0944641.1 ORF6N domain-containing protein [Lactiplantibacillus plantarum]